MRRDGWGVFGAAAGAAAIALYLAGSLIMGTPPDFDAPGPVVASYLGEDSTRIQLGAAVHAAWAPLFLWFLATVHSLAHEHGPAARRAAAVALACGAAFLVLFLVDVTALAVGALRPENMAADPELATALHDVSWLAMGMAAPLVSGMLVAFAVLSLRDGAVWPAWLGRLAAVAAAVYALRVGTLFTTDGAFAADGVLGLWAPVAAAAAWIVAASLSLVRDLSRAQAGALLSGRQR